MKMMSKRLFSVDRGVFIAIVSAVLIASCVRATIPSTWEVICATFYGGSRDNACPIPARLSASMVVDSGQFIRIFGGSGGVVPRSDLWAYNISGQFWFMNKADWRETQSSWTEPVCSDSGLGTTLIPRPRFNPLLAVDTGGYLVVGGGTCSDYESDGNWRHPSFLPDFFFFSPQNGQWYPSSITYETDAPGTTNFSSVLYEHKVYIFGGVNDTDPNNVTYSNRLWIIDLEFESGSSSSSDFGSRVREVIPGPNDEWPDARSDHTAVVSGTRMYVFGGHNGPNFYGDMWSFDFDTQKWNLTVVDGGQEPPSERFGHASAVCRGASPDMSDLIVIHGGECQSDLCRSDTYGYSIGQRIWLKMNDGGYTPSPRVYASLACGADGELWLFGGVDDSNRVVNDFYRMY